MLFKKVTKEHLLKAIKVFEEKGLRKEFGPSSTCDVIFQDKKYPPKELWDKLELGNKRSNSQMDVVLALWEHGLINL
jgi:hypothetical protein